MQKKKLFSQKEFSFKLPINIKNNEVDRFESWKVKAKNGFPEIFEYTVSNVYVSPFGLLFKNGFIIKEALYDGHKATPFTFYKKFLTSNVRKISETCIVFHHAWYDNYYHWYTECLPRLFILKHHHQNSVLILPEELKRFHNETIAFFDFKDIIYCSLTEIIKCKEVIFTNFTTKNFGVHRNEIMISMANYFKYRAKLSTVNIKNIYTPRTKAPKRNCVNEQEVLAILREFEFESIIMDDLSQTEQISLFANAQNIIGVHGSSFINLMYMNNKGVIFDLIEKRHKDLCYSNLAHIFGIDYVLIESEGVGNHSDFRDDDIKVNSSTLKKLLNEYLIKT